MKFSEDQIKYLEDKILNIITPIVSDLELALMGKGYSLTRAEMALERLDEVTKIIRSLRPYEKRYVKR